MLYNFKRFKMIGYDLNIIITNINNYIICPAGSDKIQTHGRTCIQVVFNGKALEIIRKLAEAATEENGYIKYINSTKNNMDNGTILHAEFPYEMTEETLGFDDMPIDEDEEEKQLDKELEEILKSGIPEEKVEKDPMAPRNFVLVVTDDKDGDKLYSLVRILYGKDGAVLDRCMINGADINGITDIKKIEKWIEGLPEAYGFEI